MPRFTLTNQTAKVLAVIEAATWMEAQRSPAARRVGATMAIPYREERDGPDVSRGNTAGEQLLEEAQDRLAEAFARLGLSERAVDHAIDGRGGTALDRDRRDHLSEAAGGLRGVAPKGSTARLDSQGDGVYQGGRKLSPREEQRRRADRERAKHDPRSGGWDRVTPQLRREGQAKTAATAKSLVDAGYDPDDVARALGIPVKAKQSGTPATAAPPAFPPPADQAPAPAAATESARSSGDGEIVLLVEGEDRLEAALRRGFGLTEAEARHAGEGRRR